MKWVLFSFSLYILTPTNLIGATAHRQVIELTGQRTAGGFKIVWPTPLVDVRGPLVVYRRPEGRADFGEVTRLALTSTEWVDTSYLEGQRVEYKFVDEGNSFVVGILLGGSGVPAKEQRGKVILAVDTTVVAPLASEIARLTEDLIGDGWSVAHLTVPRDDNFISSGALQRQTKDLIVSEYRKDPVNTKCVFLLGHVPVPYSGNMAPDGHTEHFGAWPADVYYGDMNGVWTDNLNLTASNSTVTPRIRNYAGDGKFDQNEVPGVAGDQTVELAVGRVDLSAMPTFGVSEVELLRRYLDKDHAFRHRKGVFDNLESKSILYNGFSSFDYAWTAYRTFAATVGPDQLTPVSSNMFFPALAGGFTLWAYGAGGGNFTGAAGVGTTADFATLDPHCPFYMLFGSFFGDWDTGNNFLRAPLASVSYGLASIWGGRPGGDLYVMGLGEPIGEGLRLSQTEGRTARGSTVLALMGDPTLRLWPPLPPQDAVVEESSGAVTVRWSAPADTTRVGFRVYRSNNPAGPFSRISAVLPPTATRFVDTSAASGGTYTYQVRSEVLRTSPSGTFHDLSQVVGGTVRLPNGPAVFVKGVLAYPSPATGNQVTLAVPAHAEDTGVVFRVFSLAGESILEERIENTSSDGRFTFVWDIRSTASGVYFLLAEVSSGSGNRMERTKFAIQR